MNFCMVFKQVQKEARTREVALKIRYDFSASDCADCNQAYVFRTFTQKIDLHYYNKINIWVNFRSISDEKDILLFRVGSSEKDYIEFRQKITSSGWQLLSFNLPTQQTDTQCLSTESVDGCPSLSRVSHMSLGIEKGEASVASKGTFWINDIFVSDNRLRTDNAYKVSNTVKAIRPVFHLKEGIPVLNNIEIAYDKEYEGENFYSFRAAGEGIAFDEDKFRFFVDIFPWWASHYNFQQTETTSTLNQETSGNFLYRNSTEIKHDITNEFKFINRYLPHIKLGYGTVSRTSYRNSLNADNTLNNQLRNALIEVSHEPTLYTGYQSPEFFKQKIDFQSNWATRFTDRSEIQSLTSNHQELYNHNLLAQEDFLQSNLTYYLYSFSIKPTYQYKQNILLNKNFVDTSTKQLINGEYYFPFFYRSKFLSIY